MIKVEPENLRNLSTSIRWQELESVVNSGASETVIGEGVLSDIASRESAASRRVVQPTERHSATWVNSHLQHTLLMV